MSASYSFICTNVTDRPVVFVTDADGELVYLHSYDFGAAYIDAARDVAALAKDLATWRAWDSDCIDEDARELYEFAKTDGADLARGDDADGIEVMTPGDLINYNSTYSFYEFVMAFYLEAYRDDMDFRGETPARDFCMRFLDNVEDA